MFHLCLVLYSDILNNSKLTSLQASKTFLRRGEVPFALIKVIEHVDLQILASLTQAVWVSFVTRNISLDSPDFAFYFLHRLCFGLERKTLLMLSAI